MPTVKLQNIITDDFVFEQQTKVFFQGLLTVTL